MTPRPSEERREFDLVFAKDVIEHIEDDAKFLRNMNAHLKDGGKIVVITQNSLCLNFLIQGSYHYLRGNTAWCGWNPEHVRFYNYLSLKRKLADAGFETRQWFGSYYIPYLLLRDHLGKIFESKLFCAIELLGLSNIFPLGIFGWNIGVVAEKRRDLR